MPQYNAVELKCNQAGTIEITRGIVHEPNHTDDSGALARYQATSADTVHEIARRHERVLRPNTQLLKSEDYSIRMARNDFKSLTE